MVNLNKLFMKNGLVIYIVVLLLIIIGIAYYKEIESFFDMSKNIEPIGDKPN